MSNRETRETSPEISLSPEKIDAWVYSKYKLSTLSYFANLEDEFFENEEVQDFPKEIKISPESWKEMYRLLEKNLDGTLFEQITEDLLPYNADREPAFPVFLFSTLKKYPTFRKLLAMNIQNIEKVQNNTSNILTPLKICQAISGRYLNGKGLSTEIIQDSAGSKAILLIHDTGKGKTHIYDPLARFRKIPDPIPDSEDPGYIYDLRNPNEGGAEEEPIHMIA